MKKLKFCIEDDKPFGFIHNNRGYEILATTHDNVPILAKWHLGTEKIFRIRKTDDDGTITDFYVFDAYTRKSANYFRLSNGEYIRLKVKTPGGRKTEVTFFAAMPENIADHALFISQKGKDEYRMTKFGIKAINDKKNEGEIESGTLFCFDGENFQIDDSTTENRLKLEFFEQTMANMIDLMISSHPIRSDIGNRVVPYHINACSANAFANRTPGDRKFFKGNYVNEFGMSSPGFVKEMLGATKKKYYALTMESRIIGEKQIRRIDSYIFDAPYEDDRTHVIRHQDGIQFMHFTDYLYHIRYEADSMNGEAVIKVFENSTQILLLEVAYYANTDNKLEKLPQKVKAAIAAAMTKLV